MQIQTIEEKTGLDRATIRYYEQEGLIMPQRLQNGYRDYSEKQLQDLLKIKLLRELGLSLDTISQLIDGNEDLQSVLGNQLIVLKAHKTQVENAEAICKMILQDKVTYETIVPGKYYIASGEKKCIENEVINTPYTEYVYLEAHPVRRYVGRWLDQLLTSTILMLIVVVILRLRPFGDVQNNLLSVASLLLYMPINALFLCIFGTTPGKFVVGIYLKTPEGKNMSFDDALRREWAVFRYGMGFGIPIYNLVRLIKSYNIHTAGRELEWDYDYNADVLYTQWDTKRGVLSAVLAIICVIAIGFSAVDAQFPKHRNADLTLAQFAENYNIYAKQNRMTSVEGRLSEEGEWYTPGIYPGPDKTVNEVSDGLRTEYWHFSANENQELTEISIAASSSSRVAVMSRKISLAVYTAIMSQPDADIRTAVEAEQMIYEFVSIADKSKKHFNFNGVIVDVAYQEVADIIYKADVVITIP